MTDNETPNAHTFPKYQPPGGVVLIAPTNIQFIYDQGAGVEVIMLMLDDPSLGPFAVLFEPQAAQRVGINLITMSGPELDQLRAQYRRNTEAAE